MQRSSIIATVVAAGGVLIAGSVASYAVINAASSSNVQASNIDLVDGTTSSSAPAAPAVPAASDPSVAPAELPSLEASALPELPQVSEAAQPAAPAAPVQQTTKTAKTQRDAKPADESVSAPSQTADPGVSADEARSIVMKQGDGVKTLAVSKDTRKGYKTWAVRIQRSSGEVITGYVDRESGVVVDWVVNAQPAAPTTTSGGSKGSDDSQEAESEDHSGSGSGEHESEDSGEFESQDD